MWVRGWGLSLEVEPLASRVRAFRFMLSNIARHRARYTEQQSTANQNISPKSTAPQSQTLKSIGCSENWVLSQHPPRQLTAEDHPVNLR